MPAPVSATFDIFDWSGTADIETGGVGADGLLTMATAAGSVSGPLIQNDPVGVGVQLQSLNGVPSRVVFDNNIPDTYTVEFQIALTALPADFSDPTNSHVFVGILDVQGKAGGLLFSQTGLAVVGDPSGATAALSGSSGLIVAPAVDDLTVRLVVDGPAGTASLYVTLASQVGVTGHVLRHTVAAPSSVDVWGDSLVLEVVGTAPNQADIIVRTMRLASSLVVPNKPPVAVIGDDQAVAFGSTVQLDGSASYDPEDADLTYAWTTLSEPSGTGTDIVMTGMVRSSIVHGDVTFTSALIGSDGNGQQVVITGGAVESASVDGSGVVQLVIIVGTTTATDLVEMVTDTLNAAYSTNVAALITATVTGVAANLATTSVGLTLVGGVDSTDESPIFYATRLGLYRFRLVVNDGSLNSASVDTLVNSLQSPVALGEVPDGKFIWNYLSDFWERIKDKDKITNVWRSVIQLAGAQMLRLWQNDYGKSLRDIPRNYTERWLGYATQPSTTVKTWKEPGATAAENSLACLPLDDLDEDITTTSVIFSSTAFPNLVVGDSMVVSGSTSSSLVTVVQHYPFRVVVTDGMTTAGSTDITSATAFWKGKDILPGEPVFIVRIAGNTVRGRVDSVVNGTTLRLVEPLGFTEAVSSVQVGGAIDFAEDAVDRYLVIDSGTSTGAAFEDASPPNPTTTFFELTHGRFSDDIQAGTDLLLIAGTDPTDSTTLPVINTATSERLTLGTAIALDANQGVSWQVVRYVGATSVNVRFAPYVECLEDLEELNVREGDLASFVPVDSDTTAGGNVLAVRGKRAAVTVPLLPAVSTFGKFHRVLRLPARDRTRSVPRLQRAPSLTTAFLQEAFDYTVGRGTTDRTEAYIDFESSLSGAADGVSVAASTTFSSATFDFTGTEGRYIYLPPWSVHRGRRYQILSVATGGASVVLAEAVEVSGTSQFWITEFAADALPPAWWWAEYTYIENDEMIENNFGMLVGMEAEDFEDTQADYLSSVQALYFALWGGPTISNIQLGAGVFFNLPFAETACTVTGIEEAYSIDTGRIICRDDEDPAVFRTYFYPKVVGLADNPATEVPYIVGDSVDAFAPLSKGAVVKDYLTDPFWWKGYLDGAQELRKFHTFKVEVNLGAVEDTGGFDLAIDFVRRIKPEHTDFYLVGLSELTDQISFSDQPFFDGVLHVKDDLYVTPDSPIAAGTAQAGAASTITLAAGAAAQNEFYRYMTVHIHQGTGAGQKRTISGYVGATKVATVSANWTTLPDNTSVYSVTPAMPLRGVAHGLDYYDGQGNWDKEDSAVYWPSGGAMPTATITYSTLAGVPILGELIVTDTLSNYVGRLINMYPTNPTDGQVWLDVDAGSIPPAGMTLRGAASGATFRAVSGTVLAWPQGAYLNRERSEVWLPLDPDTILGQSYETGTLTAATAGPGQTITLAAGASAVDDTYVNWMVMITESGDPLEDEYVRIASYVGATKVATLAVDYSGNPDGNEDYSLHPPRSVAKLLGLDFFEVGDSVLEATTGRTADVHYFGPAYLRMRNPDSNPYYAFAPGDQLRGVNGELATVCATAYGTDVVYVFPDPLTTMDRQPQLGPESHADYRVCFPCGADGRDPALDMGLKADDVELFTKPFDPAVALDQQMVPSHGPGLYFWIDKKLVYNVVDNDPAGPGGGEPPWQPSPSVPAGTTTVDPLWNDNVLRNLVICRAVSTVIGQPPGGATSPLPDPVIISAT